MRGLTKAARRPNSERLRADARKTPRRHAIRLRPDLFADFPAMTWADAVATEEAWAKELRESGYAVYQH
jgi:hypothetical protein